MVTMTWTNKRTPPLWAFALGLIAISALVAFALVQSAKPKQQPPTVTETVPVQEPSEEPPAPVTPDPSKIGKIIHVVDGDTCDIRMGNENIRIRMKGIDTPERGQPFGNNATKALKKYAGQQVRVEGDESDRNGRLIADLFTLDSTESVNLELVRDSWA